MADGGRVSTVTRAAAALVLLFLPLAGGCASAGRTRGPHPPEAITETPAGPAAGAPAESPRTEAYSNFSAAVALDLEASHLEELYTYQNLSSGIKQPSLLRDAKKLRTQALARLDEALKADPSASVIMRRKGEVLVRLGEIDEAMKLYAKAHQTAPAEPQWYFRTAGQLELARRLGDAAAILEMGAGTPGDMPDELRVIAYVDMGAMYARDNRLDAAREAYEKALALAATHPPQSGTIFGKTFSTGLDRDPTAIRRALVGILKKQGKLDDALSQARQAAKDAPNDPRTVLLLSGVYEARGEFGSAVSTVERFVEDNRASDIGMFALVRTLSNAGRVDEAVARGKAFLSEKGMNASIATEIIETYRKAGRSAEAESFARPLAEGKGAEAVVAMALLELYLGEKRADEAFDVAAGILERGRGDPKSAAAVFGLIWNGLSGAEAQRFYARHSEAHRDDAPASYGYAVVLASRGEPEKAGDVFVELARKGANYPQVYESAALRLMDKGDDYAAATALLAGVESGSVQHPEALVSRLVEGLDKPGEVAALLEGDVGKYRAARTSLCQIIARAYSKAQDQAKAEGYFRKALESPRPSLADYAGLAATLYRQDRNAEAIELVTGLRKQGQGAPPLLRMLISMLSKEGKFEQARSLAADLIREQPMDVDSHIALAGVYIEGEDYASAQKELVTAQDLAEGDESATTNVRYLLGVVYEEQGNGELAVSLWRANLAADPDEADSNNAIAYHYAQAGTNLDEALAFVEKALEAEPENGAYLDTLGWVYYRKGDFAKAVENLSRAAVREKDAVIFDHLGDARLAAGDAGGALEAWKKALASRPKTKDRAKIEDKIRAHFPDELGK